MLCALADVPGLYFIDEVLEQRQVVNPNEGVDLVQNGDKCDFMLWEKHVGVVAQFEVVSAQPR